MTGLSGSLINVPAITIAGISQVSVSGEFDLTSSTLPFSFISSGPRMEIKTNDYNDVAEYSFTLSVKYDHSRYPTYEINFTGQITDACIISFTSNPFSTTRGYEVGTAKKTLHLDLSGMTSVTTGLTCSTTYEY